MLSVTNIEHTGLRVQAKHTALFEDHILESNFVNNDSVVSRYYIYPITLRNFDLISKNDNVYKEFEVHYIEPMFMDVDGDLSWNLYLVFVLSDQDYTQVSAQNRAIVESSKEYARKLIVSESQFYDFIPVGKVNKVGPDIVLEDPWEEWCQELQGLGLEFCLSKFSNKKVDNYLVGDQISFFPIRDQERKIDLNKYPSRVKIKDLTLGPNFRPHCFSPNSEFGFSNVNLLEGVNGSGKTSILEAIELLFTGDIQRERMGNKQASITDKVTALILTDGNKLDCLPDSIERKLRENKFYQKREKKFDKLNQAFHQYNYFSSEEVFKFCFDEQPNFNEAFSRIIFGVELNSVETDCFTRYKDEFLNREKSITADLRRNCEQLELLQQGTQGSSENIVASLHTLTNLLNKLEVSFDQYQINDLPQLRAWSNSLQSRLIELRNSTSYFEVLKDMALNTVSELKQCITKSENNANQLSQHYYSLMGSVQNTEKAVTDIKESINTAHAQREKFVNQLRIVKSLFDNYIKYIDVYTNKGKLHDWNSMVQQLTLLRQRLNAIDTLINNWGKILRPGLPILSEQQLVAQKKVCEAKIQEIEHDLRVNKTKQEGLKSKKLFLETIISEIKALGRHYIDQYPNDIKCPLCGIDHRTPQLLKQRIQDEVFDDDNALILELNEFNKFNEHLINTRNSLQSTMKDLEIYRTFKAALQFMIEKKIANEDLQLVGSETYKYIIQVMNSLPDVEVTVRQVMEKINVLDSEGFNSQNIQQAIQFFTSAEYQKLLNGQSIKIGKQIMEEKIHSLELTIEEIDVAISTSEQMKKRAEQEYSDLRRKASDVSLDLQKQESFSKQLNSWDNVVNRIIETEGTCLSKITFYDWSTYLEKAIADMILLNQRINEAQLNQKNQQQLNIVKIAIEKLDNEKRLCGQAIKAIGNLKPLSKYSEEFLNKNIAVISELFLSLHLPREFESLNILDRQLVAYRKGANIPCLIHQMSGGQRTTVVLSVFFALHLSLSTVPNFVLLDEPVANMDDINVLGLLDFLRQLHLARGTQIFFTTANPLVASLFRRKFSYLRNGFTSFRFRRIGERPTKIVSYTFLPEEEAGKQISIIS